MGNAMGMNSASAGSARQGSSSPWRGFKPGCWQDMIDVRDFIQNNYAPYTGTDEFLAGPTERTGKLWETLRGLLEAERAAGGVLDADDTVVGKVDSHGAGYIDQTLEQVVGVQTDKPLKRALLPYGGLRVAAKALEAHGRTLDPATAEIFQKHRKTHNDGVFDGTPTTSAARSAGIVTGLPDGYGRGRIIGDYRRVALYGVDRLIADKRGQLADPMAMPSAKPGCANARRSTTRSVPSRPSSAWRRPTASTSRTRRRTAARRCSGPTLPTSGR
jgi:formate C-acetyltransferase